MSSLSISPASATLRVGSTEAFSATAHYSDGKTALVIASWSVSGAIGSMTASGYAGLFEASAAGTGQVTAAYGGKTASALVTVEGSAAAGGLVTIEVSPATIKTVVGTTQIFAALGKGATGESIPFSPSWSISGDALGVFSWSGTTATLEATSEGTAVITCASYEVAGYSCVTIEGYYVDITVEADTYVDESAPSVTYEGGTTLRAGYLSSGTGTHYDTYLRFSLTSLPSNASIESATLYVYPTSAGSPSFQFYKLNGAFSGATTWSSRPAYGSFIFAKTFTVGQYNNISGSELLDVVRSWYANPASNHGLALKQDGLDNGTVTILSLENGSNPPILDVEYKLN